MHTHAYIHTSYLLKTLLPALLTFTQISYHHISVSTFLCNSYCLKYSFYGMFTIFILHCRMQSLLTKDSTPDGDDGNSHHTGGPLSTQSQQPGSQRDPHHPSFYNLLKWEDVSTAAAAFSIDLYIIFIMRSQVINYCV